MLAAIANRRSIRKFKDTDVPIYMIKEILEAGILAPSSKNRQPWKFVVAMGTGKREALKVMRKGLEREKINPLLPKSAQHLDGAKYTLKSIEQASAIIFIVNTLGIDVLSPLNTEEHIYEICNAQSIGAAVQNMTLAAAELGLGSLWICDTYFSYQELKDWLKAGGELFAAMAIGYADENPPARPRRKLDDVVEWRD